MEFREGIDWDYVISEGSPSIDIKVLNGPYTGTVYNYGKVKFDEEEDGNIYLRFEYNIVSSIKKEKKLKKDMDFKNYIGDILVGIMSKNIEGEISDEVGNNYFEEPCVQRGLPEESSSLPKE